MEYRSLTTACSIFPKGLRGIKKALRVLIPALEALSLMAQTPARPAGILLKENFLHPPLQYSITPFWSWNDTLVRDKIIWQMDQMMDKGVRGLYARASGNRPEPDALLFKRLVGRHRSGRSACPQSGLPNLDLRRRWVAMWRTRTASSAAPGRAAAGRRLGQNNTAC